MLSTSVTGLPERRSSRGDEVILGREPGARIGEEHQPVSLGDRALGLGAHLRLDADRILDQAAGVDDDVGDRPDAPEAVLAVARQPGHVRDDGVARAGEHVEERRLADVRAADQGDDRQHGGARAQRPDAALLAFRGRRRRASPAPSSCRAPVRRADSRGRR